MKDDSVCFRTVSFHILRIRLWKKEQSSGTVEDEDEHALEGVEGGEEVGHDDRVLIDKEEAKSPPPVVYGRRDAHHQCGKAVAAQIVVLFAGVLALKDLHQHEIELHTLQTHPGEGSQEEEMQKASKDGTGNLKTAGRERLERREEELEDYKY
ncbi:hypothetical protein EYF80_019403 [Liparis tanakae]|uniref:Uncharacterized protein n=1 Tax=Liparis tanakae TaxID=230148 RepID=A0A4Z2HXF9_9TELE|nr:hypothetical protein EYF80_019403 [Liparis tanakae]